jgi:aminopeptidase N
MKWSRGRVTGAGALALTLMGGSIAAAGGSVAGGEGVGDPYYPRMGNTGYDVQSYDVALRYRASGVVTTTTEISAVADTDSGAPAPGEPLGSFHLDFRGPTIIGLEVDGIEASYTRMGKQEVEIVAPVPIADGTPFEVTVRYKGTPTQVRNPDGSRDGWTKTGDGAVAVGEPQQTPSWIPVNDHPTDKATWRFEFDTPRKLTGVSNGTLLANERIGERRVTVWEVSEPMATYLALAGIGRYRLDEGTVAGVPYLAALDRGLGDEAAAALRQHTEAAHEFISEIAGEYPFSATGGIVDPSRLGFAMETQTRSYYPSPPSRPLVIHEVAHQWYGNSVSVERWRDIWLNEGFATYMEWLYEEETGGETAADRFDRICAANGPGSSLWSPPPGDPGPERLFATSVYTRGAMALQVLREEIGDDDFRIVVSRWAQDEQNEHGNASTQDLYAIIEEVTLTPVPERFGEWVYAEGKPSCEG